MAKVKIIKNHLEQLFLDLSDVIKRDIAKEGDVFRYIFKDKDKKITGKIEFEIIKSK